MPYAPDGETWLADPDYYEEGMAENKPGHKRFVDYQLPKWTRHPLTFPANGIPVGPKDYMRTAGDGFANPFGWSIAHVACKFGDIDLLEMCTPEELNHQTYEGHTPANYAVQHGTPWCLQWLVDHGADVTTPDYEGLTPEETIWRNARLHNNEMEWCFQAIRGELPEKNSQKAQEYRLVKHRSPASDKCVVEKLDREMLKMRKYWFSTGGYKMPYNVPKPEERPLDLPSSKVQKLVTIRPPVPAGILFPGQGSQYVGMLKEAVKNPEVASMLKKAKDILGWDVEEICFNGPETKLAETRYCQPVMFIAGIAALELLREQKPEVFGNPQAVAGLSLGEYTAVVAAGILSFEDGLELVKIRAEAMQQAAEVVPQLMCSVVGLDREKVESFCNQAKKVAKHQPVDCKIANSLFPSGYTVGGNKECVEELCKLATAAKALQAKPIKTGGAFHTSLMQPAKDELCAVLNDMLPRMSPPRCGIYFNITGKKVKPGTDPAAFLDLMKEQLVSEVLWDSIIKGMVVDGVKDFYECGPSKQLKSMIKRIDPEAFRRTENVSV